MAYSDKVVDHYENPRNVGSLDRNDESVGTGDGGHATNIPFIVFTLDIRSEADIAADGIGEQERVLRDDADLRS